MVVEENYWAFQSLSLFLAGSRFLLATQYFVNARLIYPAMGAAARGLRYTAVLLWFTSFLYLVVSGFTTTVREIRDLTCLFQVFFSLHPPSGFAWTAWFLTFTVEFCLVIAFAVHFPEIGFQETHWNVRMRLLTLIIIGEGVIAITRIVNMTVRPGGWTKWSFVHILGVTASVVSASAFSAPVSVTVLTKRSIYFGKSISMSPHARGSAKWFNPFGPFSTFRFM